MMTTPEFFGIFLGFAGAMAAMLFMRIAYESAIHKHFRRTRFYLKFASGLSLASWLVMTAVVLKYNKDYSVLRAAKMFEAEPETRIVGQGISQPKTYAVKLETGTVLEWETNHGMRRPLSASDFTGPADIRCRSGRSGKDGAIQFPRSAVGYRHDELRGMPGESTNSLRL